MNISYRMISVSALCNENSPRNLKPKSDNNDVCGSKRINFLKKIIFQVYNYQMDCMSEILDLMEKLSVVKVLRQNRSL